MPLDQHSVHSGPRDHNQGLCKSEPFRLLRVMRSPCLLVLLGCPWDGKHGQGLVKDGSQSVARIIMTQGDRLTGEEQGVRRDRGSSGGRAFSSWMVVSLCNMSWGSICGVAGLWLGGSGR